MVGLGSRGGKMSTNDVTGDALRTRAPSKAYDDGYDRIFGKKEKQVERDIVDELYLSFIEEYEGTGAELDGIYRWSDADIYSYLNKLNDEYNISKK